MKTNFTEADLSQVYLSYAHLIDANFTNATLRGYTIYGISAWGLILEGACQADLGNNTKASPSTKLSGNNQSRCSGDAPMATTTRIHSRNTSYE
jgi:uncharacterized protein YjbI with pentapeptide repeats